MRRPVKWVLLAGFFAVAVAAGLGLWSGSIGLHAGRCLTDDEIPVQSRKAYEEAALRFGQDIVGSNWAGAYSQFSDEAHKAFSLERFTAALRPIAPNLASLKLLHVDHTYFLTSVSVGADQMVQCTTVAHGSTAQPDGTVLVAEKSVPEQAHVVLTGETQDDVWALVLWLIPEKGSPLVRFFYANLTATVGKSAADMRALARTEKGRSHPFNAAILYAGASELASRGPNFQLPIFSEIQQEAKGLSLPLALQGKPPFIWQFGASTFHILGVGFLGVGGKLGLAIRQEVPYLMGNDEADSQNRMLIKAFAAAYPEYSTIFGAVIVDAVDAHGLRDFRTTEETQSGP